MTADSLFNLKHSPREVWESKNCCTRRAFSRNLSFFFRYKIERRVFEHQGVGACRARAIRSTDFSQSRAFEAWNVAPTPLRYARYLSVCPLQFEPSRKNTKKKGVWVEATAEKQLSIIIYESDSTRPHWSAHWTVVFVNAVFSTTMNKNISLRVKSRYSI